MQALGHPICQGIDPAMRDFSLAKGIIKAAFVVMNSTMFVPHQIKHLRHLRCRVCDRAHIA